MGPAAGAPRPGLDGTCAARPSHGSLGFPWHVKFFLYLYTLFFLMTWFWVGQQTCLFAQLDLNWLLVQTSGDFSLCLYSSRSRETSSPLFSNFLTKNQWACCLDLHLMYCLALKKITLLDLRGAKLKAIKFKPRKCSSVMLFSIPQEFTPLWLFQQILPALLAFMSKWETDWVINRVHPLQCCDRKHLQHSCYCNGGAHSENKILSTACPKPMQPLHLVGAVSLMNTCMLLTKKY